MVPYQPTGREVGVPIDRGSVTVQFSSIMTVFFLCYSYYISNDFAKILKKKIGDNFFKRPSSSTVLIVE